MSEYLLITDDLRRGERLARALSVDHLCRIQDLYDEPNSKLRPRAIVSDVARPTSDAIGRLRRCLTAMRAPAVPYLFLVHGNLDRADAQARLLKASSLLKACAGPDQILAKLRDLDRQAHPISAAAHRCSAEARDFLTTAFFAEQPMTVAMADAGTALIGQAVREASIRDWVRTVQRFDDVTHQHILLVAGLAAGFTDALGLGQSDRHRLIQAALLHDVGKTKIPTAILNKPGRLDAAELTLMRTHTALGYDLLKDGGYNPEILAVVRSHHEMLDGSGYPDGLKGTEISDLVRLVTVCDIYAALIERRPYKAPLKATAALAILDDMQHRLDRDLVRAFGLMAAEV